MLSADSAVGPSVLVTGASDSTIIVWLWEQGNLDHPYRIAARLTVGALSMLQTYADLSFSAIKLAALHLLGRTLYNTC